jgi:hypothetical protein
VLGALVVGEGGPVEAVQLVVEDAAEAQVDRGRAGRQLLGQQERGPLGLLVELGAGVEAPTVGQLDGRLVDLQLDGVEHHRGGGFHHVDADGHGAGERGRREVGLQREVVAPGDDGAGQAVRVLVDVRDVLCKVGHVGTLQRVLAPTGQ